MISIKNDLETDYVSLAYELEKTNPNILNKYKELIYEVIADRYTKQFMRNQRRINALKSPFRIVKSALQEVLGENIEPVMVEEVIDTTQLENEKNKSREILENLSYQECLNFLQTANKHGLKRANIIWKDFVN